MDDTDWLVQRFEENRAHMQGVAYRMLGSSSEAEDAVQEAWLRLSRAETDSIQNLNGWLTTVVARVCLDMLRSRKARGEESRDELSTDSVAKRAAVTDPEQEVLLADSVDVALLVILDRLTPAERLAFVLHDTFAVSFEEIAAIVGRTPTAARQLASRARRRVQGTDSVPGSASRTEQRVVVDAFLAALRRGDVEGLLSVLDPEVLVKVEEPGAKPGVRREIRGARNWARGAIAYSQAARFAQAALVSGMAGVVFAPAGKLSSVLSFTIKNGRIVHVDVITNPARLREIDLALLRD